MVHAYVRRAELLDTEVTGVRFNKEQAEADQQVRDHSGDLFPGLFLGRATHPTNRTVDAEDGVMRCIRCNWEVWLRRQEANRQVEGPTCMHCGLAFSDNDDDQDDDSIEFDGFEEGSDIEIYSDEDEEEGSATEGTVSDGEDGYRFLDEDYRVYFHDEEDGWEDEDQSDEEEQDEEDDEAEDDSFIDSRDESEILAEGQGEDDTDSSIPYHTRENNYYNQHHPSSDIRSDVSAEEEGSESEEEAPPPSPPVRPKRLRRGQPTPVIDEDDTDDSIGRGFVRPYRADRPVTPIRFRRGRRAPIVISSDQE